MRYRIDDVKTIWDRGNGVICGVRHDGCYFVRDAEGGLVLPPGETNKRIIFEQFFERLYHHRMACG